MATMSRGVANTSIGIGGIFAPSAGFATAPDDSVEAARLLELVDARLLQGKRSGRDVVVALREPGKHAAFAI